MQISIIKILLVQNMTFLPMSLLFTWVDQSWVTCDMGLWLCADIQSLRLYVLRTASTHIC